MNRSFKFRYAGELAGSLVIAAVVLAVSGVVVAGRSQGWFQGSFSLRTTFDTPKGSFGLREGNEVIIMNAVAGRVGKIVPTEEGHLEATFILQEHFRQFVRKGSVARVKKKFGVAGDSFVEIEMGVVDPCGAQLVGDGDYIQCVKDEEIMETAQQALKNVQGVALPMLKEVQEILGHANGILALLEKGDGTAGALLHDKELADDLRGTVSSMRGLLDESRRTFRETTILVEAAQKHWLFRKHVERAPDNLWLTPATYSGADPRSEADLCRRGLLAARAADSSDQIARNACNVAVCLIHAGDFEGAMPYVMEARSELRGAGASPAMTHMLEAEIMRLRGRRDLAFDAARTAAGLFEDQKDATGSTEARLMIASLYCDAGNGADAHRGLDGIRRAVRKSDSAAIRARALEVRARAYLVDGEPSRASECLDSAAAVLKADGQYPRMADCLAAAAAAHGAAGADEAAAERYFRAARTLVSLGRTERASDLLTRGEALANKLGDNELRRRMQFLRSDMDPVSSVPEEKD